MLRPWPIDTATGVLTPGGEHRADPLEKARRGRDAAVEIRQFEMGMCVDESREHGNATECHVLAAIARTDGDDPSTVDRDGSAADRGIRDRQDPVGGKPNHCPSRSCLPCRLLAS